MAMSPTLKLMQIIQEGQAQMLDYLKRADERGERQSRATLKALAMIQDGQRDIAQMLLEVQAITARTLELTRDIHREVLDKKSSQH
jgi:hypothetical protein